MRRCAFRAAIAIAVMLLTVGGAAVDAGAQQESAAGLKVAQKASTRADTKKRSASSSKSEPAWKYSRSAGVAKLEYGVPGTKEVVVSFSCQPSSGLVRVVSHVGSRGVRPGDGAAIRLINGKTKFEIAGTAFSTEVTESIDIGGATRLDPKLFSLFRAGETMLLDVPGRRRTLPVASGRAGAAAFEKACGAGQQAG